MKTKSLELALNKLYTKLQTWFESGFEIIPNLILAILVIILFILFIKIFKKSSEKLLLKISGNVNVAKLIIRFVSFFILILGIFVALGIMHLDKTVTSLLAGVGIIGLAFSFAFQHTAANILSGIIISFRSTVKVGDLIETNQQFGNVLKVGLRATRIINVHGQHVEIPNRLVMDNPVKEYSKTMYRRIDIIGKMNLEEDLTVIKEKIETELSSFDFVYPEKSPNMVYNDMDFEKVNFTIRVWMNFTQNDGEFVNARSKCIERLATIFKENKISIPVKELAIIK
ncbi:MAG: small conductance mechanosensitive channel [Patiriisocius sp.]